MATLYKILGPNGHAVHGGQYRYPPKGRWTRRVENVDPCSSGYHLVRLGGLFRWVVEDGVLWEAEGDGEPAWHGEKAVFSRVRLVERVGILSAVNLRLWSADCAERVVHFTAPAGSDQPDHRSLAAIEAARKFARGEIAHKELEAAWDAAREAARDAARAAAWDAARAAARNAARAAARDAAREAAREAAWDAAWDAERDWQDQRLIAILRGDRLEAVEPVGKDGGL